MLTLSQVIYGVRDLDAATKRIEDRGLTVVDGGHHPGLGTANRIVPLGDTYFEILGVIDQQEARNNRFGRALLEQIQQGDRLVRWSLRTTDIEQVARTRELVPEVRSRRRPDGVLLTWKAAGLDLALTYGWLPFFMQWDDPTLYPGNLPVQHAMDITGIDWLEITPQDPVWLQRWQEPANLPLRYIEGSYGIHRVGLRTQTGTIILP